MRMIDLDPVTRKLTLVDGSRTVATTDGTLVCLLPTIHTFTGKVVTFPDFEKDQWYIWDYIIDYDGFAELYGAGSRGDIWVTAVEQEYDEVAQTLMTVPDGVDFIVSRIRINRTSAPSNNWVTFPLSVLPVQNEWMPLIGGGSLLMEASMGMARAMHLEAKDGDLVLSAQQSVGQAALDDWVAWTNGVGPSSGDEAKGGQHYYQTEKGIPIYRPGTSSSYRTFTDSSSSLGGAFGITQRHNKTGPAPASYTDATDYSSVYEVDVEVQFGRRS